MIRRLDVPIERPAPTMPTHYERRDFRHPDIDPLEPFEPLDVGALNRRYDRPSARAVSPEHNASDDGDPLLFPVALFLLLCALWIFGG